MKPSRGISIRWLLLGANVLALALPTAALLGLRIYHTYLLRQTERQLIAQSVLIGELWRNALVENALIPAEADLRPPEREDAKFVFIRPQIDLSNKILPPQPDPQTCTETSDPKLIAVAKSLVPTLKRAQIFNLSAVRLLDTYGCVIGTTHSEAGLTLANLPEVQQALQGQYGAVVRQRISNSPLPSLTDISRRGRYRVFSALPIYSNGQVIGVVRTSRTSLSASRSLWLNRRGLVISASASGFVVLIVSLLFARAITNPLGRLKEQAKAVVEGKQMLPLQDASWSPAEFRDLSESLTVMTQKLQHRAEYTANYAADVTHELKAPITSIRGAAELLIETSDMTDAQRSRFLNNIMSDALRMETLVNRLLQLARLENQDYPETLESIELNSFMESMLSKYPNVILKNNQKPQYIHIDPLHLSSVVTNLVENAVEKESSKDVSVEISTNNNKVKLIVTDYGSPIPKSHQNEIFSRFFTTKKDQGGTGTRLDANKSHYR